MAAGASPAAREGEIAGRGGNESKANQPPQVTPRADGVADVATRSTWQRVGGHDCDGVRGCGEPTRAEKGVRPRTPNPAPPGMRETPRSVRRNSRSAPGTSQSPRSGRSDAGGAKGRWALPGAQGGSHGAPPTESPRPCLPWVTLSRDPRSLPRGELRTGNPRSPFPRGCCAPGTPGTPFPGGGGSASEPRQLFLHTATTRIPFALDGASTPGPPRPTSPPVQRGLRTETPYTVFTEGGSAPAPLGLFSRGRGLRNGAFPGPLGPCSGTEPRARPPRAAGTVPPGRGRRHLRRPGYRCTRGGAAVLAPPAGAETHGAGAAPRS